MIYLLHGKDSYGVRHAFEEIRARLRTPGGELESNTVFLDGAKMTPLELMQHVTVMPFLAPARLVVVEGLLAALGRSRGGRKKKDGPRAEDPLEGWRAFLEQATDGSIPETTTLVLLEEDLSKNAALPLFAKVADARQFEPIKDRDVAAWIRDEVRNRAATGSSLALTDTAVRALAQAVGPDLWALSSELDKLDAFAQGAPVDESAVRALVADAREAKLWDLTDAVVAGNEPRALTALDQLLLDGEHPAALASSIARQYRQLVLARDLREHNATEGEIARVAGVPAWKAKDVAALASRYTWAGLRRAYALLLEADLNVKRGLQDDESALQLLVHELCALATRASAPVRAQTR